jgi:hypothetical protein
LQSKGYIEEKEQWELKVAKQLDYVPVEQGYYD